MTNFATTITEDLTAADQGVVPNRITASGGSA